LASESAGFAGSPGLFPQVYHSAPSADALALVTHFAARVPVRAASVVTLQVPLFPGYTLRSPSVPPSKLLLKYEVPCPPPPPPPPPPGAAAVVPLATLDSPPNTAFTSSVPRYATSSKL